MTKSKSLTKVQTELIDGLVAELIKVNQVYETEVKSSKASPFDISGIVSDIADKQKVVDENKALKTYWMNYLKAQMIADVKKMNKALDKIGFFAETYYDREVRRGCAPQFYTRIFIISKFNKTSYGNEESLEINYQVTTDNSKRADLATPCGIKLYSPKFEKNGYALGSSGNVYCTTIEELFANISPWIKRQYEQATLKVS